MSQATKERSALKRYLPILTWLPAYRRDRLRSDVVAGLAVWAVTVPQGLAYAGIAGVPAVHGLYTVPLAMIGYAIFGTSRMLSVGPDSATAIISAVVVGGLVAQNPEQYVVLTAALAVLVGLLFLLFGLLRLGWVANFLASPVQKGFVNGLAIMVMIDQVPKLFGVSGAEGGFLDQLWAIIRQLPEASLATTAAGLGSLLLLFALKRFLPRAPGALITLFVAIVVSTAFDLAAAGVDVVGEVTADFAGFGLPGAPVEALRVMLPGALAIVLVGYAESLGGARAAAEKTGEEIDANQELLALGVSNVGSGISTGFVVAGSLSRTSVAREAGGKSQVVSLVNAGLVLLTLLILMPFFANLPQATLGAVVIVAMTGALTPAYFGKLYRYSRLEFWYAMAAFLGELVLGILPGVMAGVLLSLLATLRGASHPGTAVVGKMGDSGKYRDVSLHPEATAYPGLLIFRFDALLFFPNANFFNSQILRYVKEAETPVRQVLVDAEAINRIDSTAAEHLIKLKTELDRQGIALSFAELKDPLREKLRWNDLEERIGAENFHETIDDGVRAYLGTLE